jgi:hypothetical protein
MSGSVRRGLSEARGILFNPLDLLKIERETNPTIAAYVEAKRSKGDQKDVDMAVEKYARAGVVAAVAAAAAKATTLGSGIGRATTPADHLLSLLILLLNFRCTSCLSRGLMDTEDTAAAQDKEAGLGRLQGLATTATRTATTEETPPVRERSRVYSLFT